MRYTIVANGEDNYASFLGVLGGSPLDTRLGLYLSQYDQVLSIVIDDKSRLFSILGGTYPFQATITLETLNSPTGVANVAERVKLAIVQATGHFPSAVSVVSAGQPMPAAPSPGLADTATDGFQSLVSSVSDGLGITLTAAKVLIVALGIGGVFVVYYIAKNPGKAAKALR